MGRTVGRTAAGARTRPAVRAAVLGAVRHRTAAVFVSARMLAAVQTAAVSFSIASRPHARPVALLARISFRMQIAVNRAVIVPQRMAALLLAGMVSAVSAPVRPLFTASRLHTGPAVTETAVTEAAVAGTALAG